MNFLFIHSWQGFSLAEWYLRSALTENYPGEINFHALDLPGTEIPANDLLPRALFYHKPDLVGFSCFYWNIDYFVKSVKWIKEVRPNTRIVFGGPQVRSVKATEKIFLECAELDFIIRGEGEAALCMLMDEIASGDSGNFHKISNLSFRMDGTIRHNPETRQVTDRNLIFCKANKDISEQISALDEVSYETVKGCYEKCAFCYYPTSKYGTLDDELVFSELSFLCDQPIKNLRICDTHFGGNAERAKRILRHIAPRNNGIAVRIYPDVNHIDGEYIDLLKASGSIITSVSIQSTNLNALRVIGRKAVHRKTSRIRLILEAFPDVPADLIIGLPGDSVKGLKQTFNDVLDLGFSQVNLFRLMLFPGTQMYENRSAYFGDKSLIVSSTGQVIASSDFPPEVQPELSHMLYELEARCASVRSHPE